MMHPIKHVFLNALDPILTNATASSFNAYTIHLVCITGQEQNVCSTHSLISHFKGLGAKPSEPFTCIYLFSSIQGCHFNESCIHFQMTIGPKKIYICMSDMERNNKQLATVAPVFILPMLKVTLVFRFTITQTTVFTMKDRFIII